MRHRHGLLDRTRNSRQPILSFSILLMLMVAPSLIACFNPIPQKFLLRWLVKLIRNYPIIVVQKTQSLHLFVL